MQGHGKTVNPPPSFNSFISAVNSCFLGCVAVLLGLLTSSLAIAQPASQKALTASGTIRPSVVATLFDWKGLEGEGLRLHYLPSDMPAPVARRLLADRNKVLNELCNRFHFIPPKAIDVYLAPASAKLGGPRVFPSMWMTLASWGGSYCEEDLYPGRTLTRLFVTALAGDSRVPHPFFLAGLVAEGSAARNGAISPHVLLRGRASADGITAPYGISTKDLAATSEQALLKAASFFTFLAAAVGRERFAAVPQATAILSPSASNLSAGWLKTVRTLTGLPLARTLTAWNEHLQTIAPELPVTSRHYTAARQVLASEGEQLATVVAYRDSPTLEFVATTKAKELYLLGYRHGSLQVFRRHRRRPPSFAALRLSKDALARQSLSRQQLSAINQHFAKRQRAVAAYDEEQLRRLLGAADDAGMQSTARASRLVKQLRRLRVKRVRPAYRITSEMDLGPVHGIVDVETIVAFEKGKLIDLKESWHPRRRRR